MIFLLVGCPQGLQYPSKFSGIPRSRIYRPGGFTWGWTKLQQKIWGEAPSAWRGTMILPESAAPEQVEVDQSHTCGRATCNIHIRNNSQEKTESTKICRVFNTVNTCFDREPNAASAWGEQQLPWKLICLFWVQKMRLICLMSYRVFSDF